MGLHTAYSISPQSQMEVSYGLSSICTEKPSPTGLMVGDAQERWQDGEAGEGKDGAFRGCVWSNGDCIKTA